MSLSAFSYAKEMAGTLQRRRKAVMAQVNKKHVYQEELLYQRSFDNVAKI